MKSSGSISLNYVFYVKALKMIRNGRIFICTTSLFHGFSLGQKKVFPYFFHVFYVFFLFFINYIQFVPIGCLNLAPYTKPTIAYIPVSLLYMRSPTCPKTANGSYWGNGPRPERINLERVKKNKKSRIKAFQTHSCTTSGPD